MLFNSYVFVLLFLPITVLGFYLLSSYAGYRGARLWLLVAALVFYGWWNPVYIWLLLASVTVNFGFGQLLLKKSARQKQYLLLGICANLFFLGYFKYANFFIANINAVAATDFPALDIILPLGISFFTLQQMAFLFDTYEGLTEEKSFLDYMLFTTFFPLLLSGPIVHHRDVLPQFQKADAGIFNDQRFAFALFVFAIGLFKKTVIADGLSATVAAGFDSQAALTATDAWITSFAYLLQVYFDFSGYSDMAVGIGLLLNIQLPINFKSPYKATSIIQFWQRWHITLTDFINTYVYMPLIRAHTSFSFYYSLWVTVIAMAVVGFWHGASWNYVLFGVLQGLALVVNHLWRRYGFKISNAMGWLLTILWWHYTLVIFRATSMDSSWRMLKALYSGPLDWIGKDIYITLPAQQFIPVELLTFVVFILFGALLACCVFLKNPHEHSETFAVNARYFLITLGCLLASLLLMNHVTEFIYFQF